MRRALPVLWVFIRRDYDVARSYRFAFAFEILTAAANVAVFYFLSRLIDDEAFADDQGLREGYFAFAVVGIAFLGVANAGFTTFANQLRNEQLTGTLETLAAMPLRFGLIVLSGGLYGLMRAAVVAALTLLIAALVFGFQPSTDLTTAILGMIVILATLALVTAVGLALAAMTLLFRQTARLMAAVTVGLTLFSGAYYPLEVLPAPIDSFAQAVPVTWALDSLRAVLLGGEVDGLKVVGLVVAAGVAGVAAMLSVEACADRAKKLGTLATY